MKEKIAWAEANAVIAPTHAFAIAEAEEEAHACCSKAKSCCPPKKTEPKPATRVVWLSAVEAQGCGGKPADAVGLMTMPPAIAGKYVVLRADVPPAYDWLVAFDDLITSHVSDVSTPPPNLG